MRITGGNLRGRIIQAPANLPVRPTTDFAKTALFNILTNYFDFEKLTVLDLFAGTGSIAYEFASRDVLSVNCVDKNADCIRFIKKTAALLNADCIKCVQSDVFSYISHENTSYDIIFADPPYDLIETDKLPELIFERNLLKKDGWLIIEHQSKRILESSIQPHEIRKYSNCAFSIFMGTSNKRI